MPPPPPPGLKCLHTNTRSLLPCSTQTPTPTPLPQEAVAKLISSVAGLAAPGSRLAFDFLRADALDGSVDFSGYQNCAYVCVKQGLCRQAQQQFSSFDLAWLRAVCGRCTGNDS